MVKPPPHDSRANGLYQHAIMSRMAATEYNQLVWLARRREKKLGTLVRELVTDELAHLMAAGTPLRIAYDRDRASKRRNTPIERVARTRPPAPAVTLEPAPTGALLAEVRAIHDEVTGPAPLSTAPDEQMT